LQGALCVPPSFSSLAVSGARGAPYHFFVDELGRVEMFGNATIRAALKLTAMDDKEPLPHPGVYFGAYPYQQEQDKGRLEAFLAGLAGSVAKPEAAHTKHWLRFTRRIEAMDKPLSQLSEPGFDNWILDIKKKLHQKGLSEEITARAFATIREAAGRTTGMKHFDSQIIGGWVMLQGMIAEMQTGEGKTLTATLPAGCAAMAGMPVHVVTVNDYLVERDAKLMQPVYERLGLTVGYVIEGMEQDERKQAYQCDITYCTSKQLAFDYLRDRLILKNFNSSLEFKLESLYTSKPASEQLLLRGLNYVLVDEADSVFIDEARTPLILSCKTDNTQQEAVHREAVWLARQLKGEKDYTIDEKARHVELTQFGKDYLTELADLMHGVWQGVRRRNALVQQALTALHLYERDVHYMVDDGRISIIDENTGRAMPDRSWEAGLHQMIEEKEGCEQTGQTETLARISYQTFFKRYIRLSGMTGTAKEVRKELNKVYALEVVTIPTNKPVQRIIRPEVIYRDRDSKWRAIIDSIRLEHGKGRPVLVGTRTLKDSELLSEMLTQAGLQHQVLNAKQDREEADIIARAGQCSQITVATNMAGRGTDIKLDQASLDAGGLHVISCEKNISARIDRQLAGRCGRQGDPGSYEAILSLEDDFIAMRLGGMAKVIAQFTDGTHMVRPQWLGRRMMALTQMMSEYYFRQIRNAMMKVDKQRDAMLAFSGKSE
jgi:preprotein translocase subunit SecA